MINKMNILQIFYSAADCASSLNTFTTDSNANQFGISSLARNILRNFVPRFKVYSSLMIKFYLI